MDPKPVSKSEQISVFPLILRGMSLLLSGDKGIEKPAWRTEPDPERKTQMFREQHKHV